MSGGVSVVTYSVDDTHADELLQNVREHFVPAARETPGYRGMALFDLGDGKRMAVLLFDAIEDVGAAQQALTPVGREHTYRLMSGPAIGAAGTILIADGILNPESNGLE